MPYLDNWPILAHYGARATWPKGDRAWNASKRQTFCVPNLTRNVPELSYKKQDRRHIFKYKRSRLETIPLLEVLELHRTYAFLAFIAFMAFGAGAAAFFAAFFAMVTVWWTCERCWECECHSRQSLLRGQAIQRTWQKALQQYN